MRGWPGGSIVDPMASDRVLSDGVVTLRPIGPGDAAAYFARQDAEVVDRFEWDGPASRESLDAAIAKWVDAWDRGLDERNFAITLPHELELVGDCEVELRPEGCVNVMYVVFAPWRRRGIATRSVKLLMSYADREFPGRQLLFRIHPDNHASLAVARRAGCASNGTESSRTGRVLERWVTPPSELSRTRP